MSLPEKKKEAMILRQNGLGIKKISLVLNISQSTVSRWCKDIVLSKNQKIILTKNRYFAGIKSLKKYNNIRRQIQQKKKQDDENAGKNSIGKWSKRDLYIAGLALYWGEGYKKGNNEFGFTNSDPKIILIIIKWLEQIYKVKRENLILRVSINEIHKHRVNEVLKYWCSLTGTDISQFTKTSLVKTKVLRNYKNYQIHFGTLRIKIRNGSGIRTQILSALKEISSR
ncbi:MAG: hypothetical protein A2571_03050 [Candidatus Vogelbacteria bacterium RIFOXYD1_FULL_44_32]|uniref:Resolvase HTH domain-containing protein n=1 Tax=Candidatus Vogelbacteria bacterium RIFOXYD1_FULL_44_32 TaxID=1802438 RepID=A0A1G2QCB3_9BACT|nr:MAG: hypothetical protein A2571_03050 [Candidatus Vogelbacteria bacterium RIFOXYD1_FULL_44_32]